MVEGRNSTGFSVESDVVHVYIGRSTGGNKKVESRRSRNRGVCG